MTKMEKKRPETQRQTCRRKEGEKKKKKKERGQKTAKQRICHCNTTATATAYKRGRKNGRMGQYTTTWADGEKGVEGG